MSSKPTRTVSSTRNGKINSSCLRCASNFPTLHIVAKLSGHTRTTQTAQKIVWFPRKLKKIHHPIACPTNIPGRNRHKIHSLPFLQEVHSVLVRVTDTHQKTTPQIRTHRPFQSIPLRCHLGPRLACSRVGPTFARLRRRIVLTHHTGRRRPSSRSNRATSTSWVSLAPTVPIHPRPGVRLDTVFLSSCPAAALVLPPGPTWGRLRCAPCDDSDHVRAKKADSPGAGFSTRRSRN